MGNDLASILNDDLTWLERAIRSQAMPSVRRFAHFNTNMVLASGFASLAKLLKGSIGTMLRAYIAVAAIALVQHEAIEAILVAAACFGADTF